MSVPLRRTFDRIGGQDFMRARDQTWAHTWQFFATLQKAGPSMELHRDF